ncbi:MAG: Rieske 2Fe-2S domain-containing protein [Chlorobium phaeobacteroides]|nr:Rieske 2Fe-2S domain-containing protein [Chlorobium phaeobacteroides]
MSENELTTDQHEVEELQVEPEKRRDFLKVIGWGGIAGFIAVNLAAFVRFLYPRVLFEPPTTFKVGNPADFPPGQVNTQFISKFGTWVVRQSDGSFFAMEAKCTHLGCTPNWLEAQQKFKCPCHGSGYYITGFNFEGPAPRPMDRYKISIAEDGQLLVDKSIKFKGMPGEDSNQLYPQSLLRV